MFICLSYASIAGPSLFSVFLFCLLFSMASTLKRGGYTRADFSVSVADLQAVICNWIMEHKSGERDLKTMLAKLRAVHKV